MLVLSRKAEQSLRLGEDIVITVLAIEGDRVKIGIEAPRHIPVLRDELYRQVQAANEVAATAARVHARQVAAALRGHSTSVRP
jgi:carbon storage regulator